MSAGQPRGDQGTTPQLRTILLTDLVGSTALVERLGDVPASELFREHDRLVLELQQRWRGRLIDRSDGLLLLFERAIDGLGFALDYTLGLRAIGKARAIDLQARSGLHVGEVLTWKNSEAAVQFGAKPLEVEGLAKPMAARLMTMARPGQILISAMAEPLARRASRELGERGQNLLWKSYGRWRFKGIPEAHEVYEVGEVGIAPLRAPPNGAKAWRDIPLWRRPAALAAEVLLLVALGLGGWISTRSEPAIAFAERDWVVVGDVRNLTGDSRLDESLQQAFRISLEQSHYVNLISDLKVRETLQRMQREPGVAVDRVIGSEIALRDGARALLLPTIAEVGGRLRVSAEVVDPRTQATVYALSADGRGIKSALGSIDDVTSQLRLKLGEALNSVQKNSVPLPNVSTDNLEALKAYAVARQLSLEGKFGEALAALQTALSLDGRFASAHAAVGYVHANRGDMHASRRALERALSLQGHMTPRERMQLRANWAMFFESPAAGYRAWKALAGIFPDHGNASYMLAQLQVMEMRRYASGLQLAVEAARPQSGAVGPALYIQGIAQLGLGDFVASERSFEAAARAGVTAVQARAAGMAARQRLQEAEALLDKGFDALEPGERQQRLALSARIAMDNGNDAGAAALMAEAREVAGDSGDAALQMRFMQLAVAHAAANTDPQQIALDLRGFTPSETMDAGQRYALLIAKAWIAADLGEAALLDTVLRELKPAREMIARDWPSQALVLQVLDDRRKTLAGEAAASLADLQPRLAGPDVHSAVLIAALEAARASGNRAQSAKLRTRLGSAIGRAYADGIGEPTGELLSAVWIAGVRDARVPDAG